MAYDEPLPGLVRKKAKPRLPGTGGIPFLPDLPPLTLPPLPETPIPDWTSLIQGDPGYQQELADITAGGLGDRERTLAILRTALGRFGGNLADVLKDVSLGGWEDLLDPATLGTAQAADTSGTSLMAQLAKDHAARQLAIQDVLAARGILSSGQTGFELGEEQQRDTIARTNAVNALLDFLRGEFGGYAGREYERGREKVRALERAGVRVRESGVEPPAPATVDPAEIIRRVTRTKTRRRAAGLVE